MNKWPKQSECNLFYGNPSAPGLPHESAIWAAHNLVYVTPPFVMHMGGDKINMFKMHIKCAGTTKEWLNTVWDNAKHNQDTISKWGMDVFSGAQTYRLMRTANRLSMHSYGCAIDIDAPRNGQHEGKAHFDDLMSEVVLPFEKLGGTWGGRWHGRSRDPMHFQFASLG